MSLEKGEQEALHLLVKDNEGVKRAIKMFKSECKEKRVSFEGEREDDLGFHSSYNQVKIKFEEGRKKLAEKNRNVIGVKREIDEIPTRSELIQYEKRLIELYEQVSSKLDETRRHINTYNTLKQQFELMEKEESLLGSITDTFQKGMFGSKQDFLQQLQQVVTGLRTNLDQAERRREDLNQEKIVLMQRYQTLLEQQRMYYVAVGDLQKQCEKLASSSQE